MTTYDSGSREEPTFGQFAAQYLASMAARLSSTALRTYEAMLDRYALPALAGMPLATISAAELNLFLNQLDAAGVSPFTRKRMICLLRGVFDHAVGLGLLATNPARAVALPARTRRHRIFSVPEIESFLAPLHGLPRAAWALLFYTGMRRGELAQLRVEDIDLGTRTVVVTHAKHGRGLRQPVPMCDELAAHLAASMPARASGYVFSEGVAAPSVRAVRRLLSCGAADVAAADARWSAAAYFLHQGYSVQEVAAFLGMSVALAVAFLGRLP
jgi:integrase